MKRFTLISLFVVIAVMIVAVFPAAAQLGDTDVSSFTVQNVSDDTATVSVTFIAEDGSTYVPTQLDGETPTAVPNPFTLSAGASQQVYVPSIPVSELPSGRYAVVISADFQVVAQAGVAGTGSLRFSGSYVGFSGGDTTTYIPSIAYNLAGWYSMISVQNVGADPADITVTLNCVNGATGTLSEADVPSMASVTWALKNEIPTGFTASTVCDGSAVVDGGGMEVVAVNNQNKPATGATNTFEAAAQGADVLYVPSLSNDFSGWNSALTIQKLGAGPTTVTVSYDDGDPDDTCNLTDAAPSCKLYMPNVHNQVGRFSAIIESDNAMQLLAVAGSTKAADGWSGATSAVAGGSETVAVPNVSKNYYGWKSAVNCQNVGGVSTTLNVAYSGYAGDAYDTASLGVGESVQIQVFSESFLPDGWQGGATITAESGAEVACTVGNSRAGGTPSGDWTSQYNAYNK